MGTIYDLDAHPEPYVTVAELASYWKVSPRTIQRDIEKGALLAYRVGTTTLLRIRTKDARRYGKPNAPRSDPPNGSRPAA